MNKEHKIQTNIGEICTQALIVQHIIEQIKQESSLSAECSNQYCHHCIQFNDTNYFPCFLHPYLSLTNWWGVNNCPDFEIKPL